LLGGSGKQSALELKGRQAADCYSEAAYLMHKIKQKEHRMHRIGTGMN